jgi:SAM-dependent methyltransferase
MRRRQWLHDLKNKDRERQLPDRILASYLGKYGSCGTLHRSNRVEWVKKRLAEIPVGSCILDVGAGEQQYKPFCTHLNYISQDLARYDGMGDGIGHPIDQLQGEYQSQLDIISDITKIPLRDASFEAVMCIEVLEHVPNPTDALRELCRLLKSGGSLLITAPFCAFTHMAPYFYQTGFSRYYFEHWLGRYGVEIVAIEYNGNYFEFLGQELRRLESTTMQYAGGSLSEVEQKAQEVLLGALNRFSQNNHGSEQYLCFGLHILARKQ